MKKKSTESPRNFINHLCDMMVEAIKSLSISEAEMKKRFTFTNVELIQELENKKP